MHEVQVPPRTPLPLLMALMESSISPQRLIPFVAFGLPLKSGVLDKWSLKATHILQPFRNGGRAYRLFEEYTKCLAKLLPVVGVANSCYSVAQYLELMVPFKFQ